MTDAEDGHLAAGGEEKAVRLLQGYIWYPQDEAIELGAYLPVGLEPNLHILWDEITPPFTFFDDGTLAATQHIFQFTVLSIGNPNPEGLLPWVAETLQEKLNATPAGVGWQIIEDLREL